MKPSYLLSILAAALVSIILISLLPPPSINSSPLRSQVLIDSRMEYHDLQAQGASDSVMQAFMDDFTKDNPILADWLHQDLEGAMSQYFATNNSVDTDKKRIRGVLKEINDSGGDANHYKQQLENISGFQPADQAALLADLYVQACEDRRQLRLQRLLAEHPSLVFAQHHNFLMSFIGYTEGLSDARHERFFKAGTKLVRLDLKGLYGKPTVLIDDKHGMMRDVDVSPDGKRVLFAWKKSDRLDDYHLYEYDLASGEIRQLTHGLGRADYEPTYLPDGDIIFASTRPEQSVPCWWTEISNLYRMDHEGKYIRRLAIDQVHTLYPSVLENGRIIYTRWDYSDRGQNYPHPLFNMNPDGTDQRVYYGGNSWFPTSLLHARSIPGTDKVMAIAAGHHTRQHGKVVVLDVKEGRDEGKGMHFVAPKREVPYERVDVAQQHGDQFRYPYPLNEEEFLVSYVPEKEGNEDRRYADHATYGLYWMDVDGRRELLFSDPNLSVGRPVPIRKPNQMVEVADTVDYQQKTGLYYVQDVYQGVGLKDIPRGTAKKIRIVRLNYRAAGVGQSRNQGEGGGSLNSNPVSIGNGAWDIKEILGDVDIHEDGSALFEVPAMESIYLQVLDAKGRVIQNTRTWDTVRPGEKKACKGCHVKKDANFHAFAQENTLAWQQKPQKIQPFYGETRGFSFIKEVQPTLDAKCVSCHDGSQEGVMSLSGELKQHGTLEKRRWSDAYLNLTHSVKKTRKKDSYYSGNTEHEVVNWISKMSKPTELEPYSFGAATSKMMHMMEEGHHGVQLTEEEYHKLAAWMDLLVPFVGEYREANDWSEEEMAYYDYYEEKRRKHQVEELANIQAWMAKNGQAQAVTAVASTIQSTSGYRQLEGQLSYHSKGIWSLDFEEAVMVDKIEVSLEAMEEIGTDQIMITVGEDDSFFIPTNLPSVMEIPQRTNSISLELKSEDVRLPASLLKKVQVWGVSMAELPSTEAHHPYLQLGDKSK